VSSYEPCSYEWGQRGTRHDKKSRNGEGGDGEERGDGRRWKETEGDERRKGEDSAVSMASSRVLMQPSKEGEIGERKRKRRVCMPEMLL
jgi:hypothetical protein